MATLQPTYIEDDLRIITESVSVALLAQLQEAQPTIEGVFFKFGTARELSESLIQLGKTDSGKTKKYPLIYMFVDVREPVGFVGNYEQLSLRLAIINFTKPTFKAEERLENNFKPILLPIYREFLRQLTLSGDMFLGASAVENISHTMIKRYYWGTEVQESHDGNPFPDFIDGIEIDNLQLKHYLTRCF